MPFSLISDPWLPVRRRSGVEEAIRPDQIAEVDDPPVVLLWPRADFNVACLELLIGLVSAACPPATSEARSAQPDRATLAAALKRLEPAFRLDGDGPRFLQDLAPLEGEPSGVDLLLIDSAGDNARKKNADLMVRHGRYRRFCRPVAAMALYTLQSQAPSGGKGNRTSMRGGGPMITLVEPRFADRAPTLFEIVWANVPVGEPLPDGALADAFPWMRPTLTSESGRAVHFTDRLEAVGETAARVEAFFGMPRRLRLAFEPADGRTCDLSGQADPVLVGGAIQRPYGTNYGLWAHPLTPTYRPKPDEAPLPVHPKPGPFGFRNWLGVVLAAPDGAREVAPAVRAYLDSPPVSGIDVPDPALLVAGWAMSNMSPLDFTFSRQPLLIADDPDDPLAQQKLEDRARHLVEAGHLAHSLMLRACLSAFRDAASDKGDLPQATDSFFRATEPAFLDAMAGLKRSPEAVGEALLKALRRAALAEFEALALPGLPDRPPEHAQKIVAAYDRLRLNLHGYGKDGPTLFDHLGLPPPAPPRRRSSPQPSEEEVPA